MLAVVVPLALGACEPNGGEGGGDSDGVAGGDADGNSCAFAWDGTCDEPVNCPLGSDSSDCQAACAAGEQLHLITAACANRDPPEQEVVDPSLGTGGNEHLTGHRDGTIEVPSGVDGALIARHYRLFVPAAYDPARPTPLVIMLPGHRVDIYGLADYTQLMRTADLNRFIVAYAEQEWRPDGRWAWWTDWDWSARPDDNPDIFFLTELVTEIGAAYNVDRSRVYAVGHSRGGAMAIIAAVELYRLFAATCSQSGFTEFEYDEVIKDWTGWRTPIIFLHGALDDDVCIDCTAGGTCGVNPARPCGTVEASDALVEMMSNYGWDDERLVYLRLPNVAHRWQPQLNQQVWDFLFAHPLKEEFLP